MTAKEYVEQATHDRIIVFERSQFRYFCEQLCREQRETVLKASKFSNDGLYYYSTKYDILNAPMPEL